MKLILLGRRNTKKKVLELSQQEIHVFTDKNGDMLGSNKRNSTLNHPQYQCPA